ncbi:MAG: M13 family metallopeptidase [Kordiimonadaceae bacterium]|nr:M13 family metallopeptidase [Kordiimonadaceae bacterium]MBT6037255.1 M13 family metallopeptidase [Kordiimonadaceae bacterium]MBT6329603.1 M13 family metallopeptidase [Kordiimonadaceae bacterium]
MKKFIYIAVISSFLAACDSADAPDQELQMIGSDEISGINFDDMNTSVHPGDDFNLYVNGGWLDRTEIPGDKRRYGSFDKLRDAADRDVRAIIEETSASAAMKGTNEQKVGDLYKSYMDMETRNAKGVKPLEQRLAMIDGISDLKGMSEYFADAGKYGLNAPIALFIGVDAKIPTEYALHTYQYGLGLPDREYYFTEDERSVEIRTKYVEHIGKMMALAGIEFNESDAETVMDLETKIAGHHWKKEENRDGNKRYNKYTNAEFKTLMSNMDIDAYLEVTETADIAEIIVSQPSYLEGLNGLLTSVDMASWKSYLKWSYVNDMASRLNEEMDNQNFDFYSKTLSGVEQQRPMWQRATSTVSGNLGEVVGEVYVSKHFKPDAKARMVGLVQNLIDAYAESIKELDWMGAETKQKALAKLAKFTPKIGYPDQWKDYSELEISADDLSGNIERSALTVHRRELAKLGGPIDRTEWGMFPQTVNAYYNPTMNEIVFPAAILQPPFFNMPADDAINYGGIGGVIGHEVGHGFDDSGSRYNGDGALENWWTDDDIAKFKERTDTLVAQYDAYEPVAGTHVNGTFTLGENIGDLSGMSIAYKAYKKSLGGKEAPVIDGYTGDQRFFIGWAQAFQSKWRDASLVELINTDPHAPDQYRINGIVFNVDAFYEAFDVGPEHKLYIAPEDRVRIW